MDFLTTFDDVTKELKKYGVSLIKIDKSYGLRNLNNEFIKWHINDINKFFS